MRRTGYQYEAFANQYFTVGIKSGSEWQVVCPFHNDHSPSMRFNCDSGLYYCHSCGAKGNIKTLSRKFKHDVIEVEPDIIDLQERLALLDTPDHTHIITTSELAVKRYRRDITYWLERGVSRESIDRFELGYDTLHGSATIPVRKHTGELVGVVRRNVDNAYASKYMYPKGFNRKHLLFGSWMVPQSDEDFLVLTEGSLDAVAVWDAGFPAVAQFGSTLAKEQVDLLRKMGVWKIVLFYDHDKAGVKARKQAVEVLRDFMVYTVRYKKSDGKDPGEMPSALVAERILDARRII